MDCFYAAVEMRDNPALCNVPIAIGGSAERRGVISTCNYPARKFGVRSAMATAHALRLCPDLVMVSGRMALYAEISRQIRAIFSRYTEIIEPLSLDEAYLDVSDCTLFAGSATLIAEDIRRTIFAETGLTASAGVAPCKFVAKVASDENKPNGICVVAPDRLDEFVSAMPLGKIPGVGKVTLEKLHNLGLYTCVDVRSFPVERLLKHFGKFGSILWERCHGIDERELSVSRVRKSMGVEKTFEHDINRFDELGDILQDKLLPELQRRSKQYLKDSRISKLGVKVKFGDFQLTTKEQQYSSIALPVLMTLLEEALQRGKGKPVRLLGIHIGLQSPAVAAEQLSFSFSNEH